MECVVVVIKTSSSKTFIKCFYFVDKMFGISNNELGNFIEILYLSQTKDK